MSDEEKIELSKKQLNAIDLESSAVTEHKMIEIVVESFIDYAMATVERIFKKHNFKPENRDGGQ